MGARELALGGDKIFACVRRMGGSWWWKVVSLQRPVEAPRDANPKDAADKKSPSSELEDFVATYQAALSSLQILGENGGVSCYLCSSPDEQKVFFPTMREDASSRGLDMRDFWLSENGGDPKQVEIELSDAR
jgi:hypothetical protein